MNKRSFVVGACAAIVAPRAMAGAADTLAHTLPVPPAMDSKRGLPALGEAPGLQAWSHYLNERFVLQADGKRSEVVLDRISELSGARDSQQFRLGFNGWGELRSGLYCIEHASGQSLMIYLDNAGRAGASQSHLRAEFNLLMA